MSVSDRESEPQAERSARKEGSNCIAALPHSRTRCERERERERAECCGRKTRKQTQRNDIYSREECTREATHKRQNNKRTSSEARQKRTKERKERDRVWQE